jgi:PIN domain nuclease of toxin-antitoxin system
MQYLIDTHTFIWFVNGDDSLSAKSKKIIANTDNKCYLSIASVWEIAIKISLKKLSLKSSFDKLSEILSENEIELLPVSLQHIQQLINLPFHHRDPFDRIIIAQSKVEKLVLISKDEAFADYDIKTIWK